ncbi:MAG: AraC family transcriptional regulator [Leptolyngbyaceae cyanobacterium SL_5_9]|nr:AraC family transcriptional regulator [Leptolyngbyaceae cyanobacterium SL_5_9]
MKHKAEISVQAWESNGILLEQYAYTTGSVEPLPKHFHEEYQFGLSFDCCGEYSYRGARHIIPPGSLSIIHSGEAHSPSDRSSLPAPAHFMMMHIHPKWLQVVSDEIAEKPISQPFLPTVLTDSELNCLFLTLQASAHQTSKLEKDTARWEFLCYLSTHYAVNHSSYHLLRADKAIAAVRDYLQAHYAEDVSLEALAAIAGLSRFHLCRIFHREVGVSPATYQTQLRVSHSKRFLVQGLSIKEVAALTGFYDQSHFGWHFKRQVGVTPGKYTSGLAAK